MRSFLALVFLGFFAVLPPAARAAVERAEISFDYVRDLAVARAAAAFAPAPADLPPRVAVLSYDEYRMIQFRAEHSLWRGDRLPFEIQFFPRGGLFKDPVQLHEFSSSHVQAIPFDPGWYKLGEIKDLAELPGSVGYAGFRILFPLNKPGAPDELASFLGASYFRVLGAGQHYGLSARGLALDAGVVESKEEFPRFTEFWLGKPVQGATTLTLYALLDGPSVAGAYEFVLTPGKSTFVDVRATLIFRSDAKVPGFAPLTSMFWYGENSARPEGELRPEVHDSDGLLVHYDDNAQLWRPLRNPTLMETDDLPVHQLTRFGLIQRDRQVRNYEDLEAQYERRPTLWIEPRAGWGAGVVRLVQLPATREYGDNIVAYWIPAERPPPGKPVEFRYRMIWSQDEPAGLPARVVGTREGTRPGNVKGRMFWVDFSDTKSRERIASALKPEVEVGTGGKFVHAAVSPHPEIAGWRVAFEIEAEQAAPNVELRCRLRDNEGTISETWSYTWKP